MYKERRFLGLRIVVLLAILNSIAAAAYFILLDMGLLNITVLNGETQDYALAFSLSGIIPLAAGAIGIYRKKMWGLGLFTLGNGAYLLASISILGRISNDQQPGIILWAAVYLLGYTVFSHIYAWNIRYSFRDF